MARIELKNEADSLCYQAKSQLETLKLQLDSTSVSKVESLISSLEDSIKGEDYDFDTVKEKKDELQMELIKIGEKVYAQTETTTDAVETDFSSEK